MKLEMYSVAAKQPSTAFLQVRGFGCALFDLSGGNSMDLRSIKFADMSDEDWEELERKEKEEREAFEKSDSVAALDLYNEMVSKVYTAFQYKTVAEMLQFKFIDVYDISCLTHVPLKEIKCIQIFLEKSR